MAPSPPRRGGDATGVGKRPSVDGVDRRLRSASKASLSRAGKPRSYSLASDKWAFPEPRTLAIRGVSLLGHEKAPAGTGGGVIML